MKMPKNEEDKIRKDFNDGKEIDLLEVSFTLPEVEDLLEDLTEEERLSVRKGVKPIIDNFQEILNMASRINADPELKMKLREEVSRRFIRK